MVLIIRGTMEMFSEILAVTENMLQKTNFRKTEDSGKEEQKSEKVWHIL